MKGVALLVLLAVASCWGSPGPKVQKSYDGYKLLRAHPRSKTQLDVLQNAAGHLQGVDYWTEPRSVGKPVDVMVTPDNFENVAKYFTESNIHYEVLMENVQEQIERQRWEMAAADAKSRLNGKATDVKGQKKQLRQIDWENYYTHDEINAWLEEVAANYPDIASTFSFGDSYEGRELRAIKIGSSDSNPAILIDAGIHAREWIAPAVATYFINQLTSTYASNNETKQLVDGITWYILPSLNPDGYEYSINSDRMWRKSRSDNGFLCLGVDPNRNYGFHWFEGGSSDRPCDETYAGPEAFSEVEGQHLRDFVLARPNQIRVYLTLHSYGQYWLTPWGYTSDYPVDYDELYGLAVDAVDALTAVHGTEYTIGTSTNVLYVASGGSDDWNKGGGGVKYSYTVELRDTGRYGFTLPPNQIIPTAEETWEGFKVVGRAVLGGI